MNEPDMWLPPGGAIERVDDAKPVFEVVELLIGHAFAQARIKRLDMFRHLILLHDRNLIDIQLGELEREGEVLLQDSSSPNVERMSKSVTGIVGKRLTYRRTNEAKDA